MGRIKLIMLIVILGISISGWSQGMKKTKILKGVITMKIPKDFYEMTPDDMVLRMPSIRNPIAAYSSEDRVTDFNIKQSATQWRKEDTEIAMRFFKASIYNLFDRVKMIEEGLKEINGESFVVFEFESYIAGDNGQPSERKYNYLLYYLGLGKTIVFTFRCPEQQMDEYVEKVQTMVKSIKLKGL